MKTEKLSQFLLETLSETKGFVVEQAPDYVRQLLEYNAMEAQIFLVLYAVLILLGIFLIYKSFASLVFELFLVAVPLAVISTLLFFGAGLKLYKIKHTPKVYLMETVTNSLNGRK